MVRVWDVSRLQDTEQQTATVQKKWGMGGLLATFPAATTYIAPEIEFHCAEINSLGMWGVSGTYSALAWVDDFHLLAVAVNGIRVAKELHLLDLTQKTVISKISFNHTLYRTVASDGVAVTGGSELVLWQIHGGEIQRNRTLATVPSMSHLVNTLSRAFMISNLHAGYVASGDPRGNISLCGTSCDQISH